jgi:hypothetical protein
MPVVYRNTVTGRVVERDRADPLMDRSTRWERADGAEEKTVGSELERPSGNASTEEWRAYAVTAGMDADEVEGLSRNEIRERFEA